jgi:uncharacterized membrane protein
MKSNNVVMYSALAGVLALGVIAGAEQASAAKDKGTEKCAGVIKGGANDCATSMNACHGHVKEDANQEAWIYVPKGTCDKIVGAHITNVKAPDEK